MSDFVALVVLHSGTPNITSEVTRLLDPWYLWHEEPDHKQHLSPESLATVALEYGLSAADLGKIAEALKERYGSDQWSVDAEGVYFTQERNPRGKYALWSYDPESDIWPVSVIPSTMVFTGPKSSVVRKLHFTAVVTPDGRWHDLYEDEEPAELQEAARQQAYELIQQYPSYLVVAVDCE